MKVRSFLTIGIVLSLAFSAIGFLWNLTDLNWNTLCFEPNHLAIFGLLSPFSVLAFVEIAEERRKNPRSFGWAFLKLTTATITLVQLFAASYMALAFLFSSAQIVGWLFLAVLVIATRWFSDTLFPAQTQ